MNEKLRKKRVDKGLTAQNMADFLGYKSSSTYTKKERGEIPIKIEEARKIVIILDCTLDEIFLSNNYLNKIINKNFKKVGD